MSSKVTPQVFAHFEDSSWPPAQGDRPVGFARLSAWSVTRELVGDMLPGNVRGRSGLTIGSGKATIADLPAERLTPWSKNAATKVKSGVPVEVYRAARATGERTTLGRWITDNTSGQVSAGGVDVDLVGAAYKGRGVPAALPLGTIWSEYDAAAVVDYLARTMGYFATPAPVPSCILSLPLQGGAIAEVGRTVESPWEPRWNRDTGPISMYGLSDDYSARVVAQTDTYGGMGDQPFRLAANVTGGIYFDLGSTANEDAPSTATLYIDGRGKIAIRNTADATLVWANFVPGLDPRHTTRVEVEIQRTGGNKDGNYVWTSIRARARSSASAPWSPWATSSTPSVTYAPFLDLVQITSTPGAAVAAVQACVEEDEGLWAATSADIDLLGVTMSVPFVPSGMDTWAAIQKVCADTLGVAFDARDGTLVVRGRSWLAGAGRTPGVIDIETDAEDLEWTIDPSDFVDRVEVVYRPPTRLGTSLLWEATEVITLPANSTTEIVAPVERWDSGRYPLVVSMDPVDRPDSDWLYVTTSPDGKGVVPPVSTIHMRVRRASQTDLKISFENTGNVTLYTADPEGNPSARVRVLEAADQSAEVVVARGVGAADAKNMLSVDLGYTVQRAADAEAIADFIIGRGDAGMWKASSVRVPFDERRDVGDIVTLRHRPTGLDAKCLVSKVEEQGSADGVEQVVDLVLLGTTWIDHDDLWDGETWADHEAAWGHLTWDAFEEDPLANKE